MPLIDDNAKGGLESTFRLERLLFLLWSCLPLWLRLYRTGEGATNCRSCAGGTGLFVRLAIGSREALIAKYIMAKNIVYMPKIELVLHESARVHSLNHNSY
jgi:hypothetical protein